MTVMKTNNRRGAGFSVANISTLISLYYQEFDMVLAQSNLQSNSWRMETNKIISQGHVP